MKKLIFLLLLMTLILWSGISFAEGDETLDIYQANQVYRYDLDGDEKLDIITYVYDGESSPVLYVNQDTFTFEQVSPELFSVEFKIVDIEKADKHSEIAVSYTDSSGENLISFYRYTSSGVKYLGNMSGDFQDIANNNNIVLNTSQNGKQSSLKTYEEVYSEEGLLGSINYFDTNYDRFTTETLNQFAYSISWELGNRVLRYYNINNIEAADIPAPPTIEMVDSLYPDIYDSDTNTLNPDKLRTELRQAVLQATLDDVLMVAKSYYITEGYIEDNGFRLSIYPEVFKKLQRALDLTFSYQDGRYFDPDYGEVFGSRQLSIPKELVKTSDSSWESNASYPEVLVEDIEKLALLKDAFKTHVYIPVNIEKFGADREVSDLKGYEQVFDDGGLMACINYYDGNYDKFSDEARYTFAEEITHAIFEKINEYDIVNNSLYGENVYDKDTNTIILETLDSESGITNQLQKIKEDEVILFTKSYFVMEDEFNDNGFQMAIHPDTVSKLKRAMDLICSTDGFGTYMIKDGNRVNGNLEWLAMPEELVTASDSSWSSDEVYPVVLVEEPEQLKLLEGAWKTEVYLPVKIQEEGFAGDTVDSSSSLSGYTAETINGTEVDYAEYATVIVPMYDGVNKDSLDTKPLLIGNKYTSVVTAAIFGQISNLQVMHTNNGMNEEYSITRVGELENILLIINTDLPTDFANVRITGQVKTGTGDHENIEFTLDDMRDLSEYQPIMVK
ncbi:MAG: hypothetical protein ACLFUI_02950 [Halanaerobiales bacterium]